uniref:Uncharacterized protein n=1 Tax=Fagus sylvatica TaxID=28930 RepID=A0A2N9FZC8_FAGSY
MNHLSNGEWLKASFGGKMMEVHGFEGYGSGEPKNKEREHGGKRDIMTEDSALITKSIGEHGRWLGKLAHIMEQCKPDMEGDNIDMHHIDSHICMEDGRVWRLMGFYGRPEEDRKWQSWALLDHLNRMASFLVVGDWRLQRDTGSRGENGVV